MKKYKAFIDSHIHFLGMGYVAYLLELKQVTSIQEIIEIGKNALPESILIGRGWNEENFKESRRLTKHDLNKISNEIPIVMIRTCGHILVCNDKMLELANIDQNYHHQGTGIVDFQNGFIAEDALRLIYESYPLPSKADIKKYLIKANEICLANGITKVASDDFQIFLMPYEELIDIITECYALGLINVSITEQVNLGTLEALKDFIQKGYVNQQIHRFRLGPLKLLIDGSLGGRTAKLFEPYTDDPFNKGILSYSKESLFEMVHLADSHQMDCVIHAIGDEAIQMAIEALIQSLQITKRVNHAHAIIHAQLATLKQIELMKAYHIGAIIQPIFLNSDIGMIEKRIGDRKNESYLFHTMKAKGLSIGFSTDTPIESINPLENIYAAVSRKSQQHPSFKPFLIEEAYTIEEAYECYSHDNLKYVYETTNQDCVILDKSLQVKDPEKLLKIEVLETIIEGKTFYKKK